jgi:hypothetical protein
VAMPEAIKRGESAALGSAVRWGGLVALVGAVLIAAFAFSKAQPKAPPFAGDDAPVLAADTALGDAMRAGDKAAARRLLALQFSLVDANGKIYARKDILGDLKSVAAGPANDVKVRSYGLVVVVTGHHKAAHDADVFFLDIWVKQKGAWRALLIQDVPVAAADASVAAAPPSSTDSQPQECENPCQTIPYRVRSPAEQDIVNAFQAIMKAIVAHDVGAWGKHVADEFVVYGSDRAPVLKSGRIAAIERQKESNTAVTVGEVQTMRLAVYGDGAVMIATAAAPEGSRPPYRAARVWVKRNGQWQMAISAHTDVK